MDDTRRRRWRLALFLVVLLLFNFPVLALVDGVTEPVRLRIGHYPDEAVTELVDTHAPRSTVQDATGDSTGRELQEIGS